MSRTKQLAELIDLHKKASGAGNNAAATALEEASSQLAQAEAMEAVYAHKLEFARQTM